ncbi:MAG: hypothetical protein ACKV2V_28065, partial [Blastocatellia bacterium]
GLRAENLVSSQADRQTLESLLLLLLGFGLLIRPDAGPALEPLRDTILNLTADLDTEPPPATASPGDAILDQFTATLDQNGCNQATVDFAFNVAIAAIQEIPVENEQDARMVQDTFRRLYDVAISRAPADLAPTLIAGRDYMERVIAAAGNHSADPAEKETPLTPDFVRDRCDNIIAELNTALATGGLQAPAVLHAMGRFQELSMRLGDMGETDDTAADEALKIVVETMSNRFMEAIAPYAPADKEPLYNEMMAMVGPLGSEALDLSQVDDPAGEAVIAQRFNQQASRATRQSLDLQPTSGAPAVPPHLAQLRDLLPALGERLAKSNMMFDEKSRDAAESKRLHSRFDRYGKIIGSATTTEQVMLYQRREMRRIALETRQFERRRNLMLIHPPFPADTVMADANAVFYAGGEQVRALLEQACQTLEMGLVAQHHITDPAHGRWGQLRQSAVAVFDYSGYNPALADPAGPVPQNARDENVILDAAGPVARVAWETGWAYVTGTPMIIVARAGQPLPFDLDIEPVFLRDDGHDTERLTLAIQSALYGVQRGLAVDSLTATADAMHQWRKDDCDPQARVLLDALSDTRDATQVRFLMQAVIDGVTGEKPLLTQPVFPASYPPAGSPRLFHVSGFRDWADLARTETSAACARAGVTYHIGSQRLNPDVMRAIWIDLCQAAYVVADITNLNPNAVLELAIARALGRRILILTQNQAPHAHLPAIQKVRIHRYEAAGGQAALAALLDAFLAGRE